MNPNGSVHVLEFPRQDLKCLKASSTLIFYWSPSIISPLSHKSIFGQMLFVGMGYMDRFRYSQVPSTDFWQPVEKACKVRGSLIIRTIANHFQCFCDNKIIHCLLFRHFVPYFSDSIPQFRDSVINRPLDSHGSILRHSTGLRSLFVVYKGNTISEYDRLK